MQLHLDGNSYFIKRDINIISILEAQNIGVLSPRRPCWLANIKSNYQDVVSAN